MSSEDAKMIANEQHEFDSDEDIDDYNNWNEEEQEPIKCLFCDNVDSSIEKAVEHLDQQHHINLISTKTKFNLEQYSYIKMINYIKTHNISAECFKEIKERLWNDDKYMKPVEIDQWIMFDIEDLEDDQVNKTTSDTHKIESLERQLKDKDATIEQLLEQISQMKNSFHTWIDRIENEPNANSSENQNTENPKIKEQSHVANIPIQIDQSYFTSYAHFGIHYDMLSDVIRTSSYRDAILRNRKIFENKLVMDVGCGTAILSMFSSEAGARKVIAIDQSDIIYHAMEIAQKNKIMNIEFAKGRLENMTLPLAESERVDIIISEWMGYFLLFEGMLDSVIYARDKYLKPGGLLLPNRCTINLLGLGDQERHSEYIEFWNDVYGYDMSNMQSEVLKEAIVETCRSEHILSNSVVIADLNMNLVDYTYPNFTFNFELNIQKSGKFTAFVGYFDTFFDLPEKVEFTTGPESVTTHWKQVVFYIKHPVAVNEGDIVRGQFQCNRGKNDARALCIKIIAFNREFYYNL